MIKTTRTPVKLYKWDDEGAPSHQYVEGSIKTILKACLVTGYGEGDQRKEPLGWEIKFEEANQAVFQSKVKENDGWALSVDDRYRKSNGSQYDSHVRCNMIKNPSSLVGGVLGNPAYCGMSNTQFVGTGKWWMIGNEKGFLLITSDNNQDVCGFLQFSLFPSLVVADSGNWVLNFTGAFIPSYGYAGYAEQAALALNYEGLAVARGRIAHPNFFNSGYAAAYPNPVTGGFCADNCTIYEWTGFGASGNDRVFLRGILPGIMGIGEKMTSNQIIPFGTIYSNLDGTADRYLYFKSGYNTGMLVNIDAWEM